MNRQDEVSKIFENLVNLTNQPYVTCQSILNIINHVVPMWPLLFDAPKIVTEKETPTEQQILDRIKASGWDVKTTHDEKVAVIKKHWKEEYRLLHQDFNELFKFRKMKPTDEIYTEFNGVISPFEVCHVFNFELVDGSINWNSADSFERRIHSMYEGRHSHGNNVNANVLGFVLHTLALIPADTYISVKKGRYEKRYSIIYYKKSKNLKLETNSPKALTLIEDCNRYATFSRVFKLPTGIDMEILGKFNTSSYAHLTLNMLHQLVTLFENPVERAKLDSLVGLSKVSYSNRMTQLCLEDAKLRNTKCWFGSDYTPEDIDEAIIILEGRYQSYLASQRKKAINAVP